MSVKIISRAQGEMTLEFEGVVALTAHFPHDQHERVAQMMADAPKHDPYHAMAALSHSPINSIGTQVLRQPSHMG